jgi:hypothetical protein
VGPHAAALDSLIPYASGVCLVEVTRLREHDEREVDGGLSQVVELRPIRGTGCTTGGFAIGREAASGPWLTDDTAEPAEAPTSPISFYLPPDSLLLGQRYWAATVNPELQYEGLAGIWPEGDPRVTELFEAAIAEDAYAWHPTTLRNGWTLGSIDPPAPAPTRARVWRVGHLMWDRPLEGRLTHGIYQAWQVLGGNPADDLHVPGLPDTSLRLLAELTQALPARNRFDFPPGKAVLHDHLDLWTGRLVASSARVETAEGLECFQAYDRRGRITFERVQEWVPSGGRLIGADEDRWLRRTERWFDARTRCVTREEIARRAYLPLGTSGRMQSWLPVERDSAYALAPLKRAYLLRRR